MSIPDGHLLFKNLLPRYQLIPSHGLGVICPVSSSMSSTACLLTFQCSVGPCLIATPSMAKQGFIRTLMCMGLHTSTVITPQQFHFTHLLGRSIWCCAHPAGFSLHGTVLKASSVSLRNFGDGNKEPFSFTKLLTLAHQQTRSFNMHPYWSTPILLLL